MDEADRRLWEIAENLHRAELTVMERAEHIAEWVRLTEEKADEVSAQVEPKLRQRGAGQGIGGGRPESGINAATRDLGLDRTATQRAVKVASITPEAKEAAREAGIDDNQSALLKVAGAPAEQQAEVARNIRRRNRDVAQKPDDTPSHREARQAADELAEWLIDKSMIKTGGELHDPGFVSTSRSERTARAFANSSSDKTVLKVNIPKGAHASHISAHSDASNDEDEVLIPRNSRFKVVKYDKKSGVLEVNLMTEEDIKKSDARAAKGKKNATGDAQPKPPMTELPDRMIEDGIGVKWVGGTGKAFW